MIKDETDEGNFAVKDEVLPLFENQEPRNYDEMENLIAQGQDELKATMMNFPNNLLKIESAKPKRHKKN